MTDGNDDRIDFSSLDPASDPTLEKRVVSGVMARISVQPRRHGDGVWGSIATYLRPALVAAAVVVAVSGTALLYAVRAERAASTDADVTDSVGLPPALADWVDGGVAPTAGDLVVFVRGYR